MIAFLIVNNQDGVPRFLSPTAGRSSGGGAGWIEKADEALAFARRRDAQTYLEFHVPHIAPICSIAEREVAA
jgi:hypothetical protein